MPPLRRLPRLFRLGCALLTVASSAIFAANLAPEPTAPLPSLTLAPGATSAPLALTDHFRDPDVPGSAVRIHVSRNGIIYQLRVALFDATAPLTVANFLTYVDSGRYAANFFHRSIPGFILQNGGFRFLNDTTFDRVPTFDPVINEPGASNLRGTLAMAKLGPPNGQPPTPETINSATSEWFINLADNSANLDAQNGGFTVFGRVLGSGMNIADLVAAVPRYNATAYASAWTDLPLTTGFLARENFIETSIDRVAPLSFTVASDDPELVSASVAADGTLTLAATAARGGDTIIRITATDLEDGTHVATFPVHVPAPLLALSNLTQTYDGQPRIPTATTFPAGLPVVLLYGDPGTSTPPTAAGAYPVSATTPHPETAAPVIVRATLTIVRAPQTITLGTLPDELPVNAPARTLAATAGSGLPVAFTVEGPATLGEDGVTLSLTGEAGLVRIHADQAGDANHEPAPRASHHLTVLKRPQSIAFPALDARTYDPAADTLLLAAMSDAGLPVAYTVVSGPAHLAEDGVTLVITGAGEIVVTASQPGTATFAAAEPVTRTLAVARAAQILAFTALPPALIGKLTLNDTYPEVRFPVAATSSSGLPVYISLTSDVTPSHTGDSIIPYTVALNQVSTPTASGLLHASGGLTIDDLVVVGVVAGPVTDRGDLTFYRRVEGTVTLTATQEGDENHLPAEPVAFTIDVGRTQTIAFAQPAARGFNPEGPAPARTFVLTATATSRLPVAFEVVSGPATLAADQRTLTLHDTGTVVLRARQPGDAAYLPAPPVTRTLLVNGVRQTLAFTAPSATTFTYGAGPVSLAATTTAPGGAAAFPITFSVVKGPATLADDGHTLSLTGAGTVVILANQVGGAGTSPAGLTRTFTVLKKPLLVSGVPASRVVGVANPPLGLTYEGFVNGDTQADLATTLPKPGTKANKASPAGNYPITATGGSDANYVFRPGPVKNLTVVGVGGTYDALLGDESAPLGKLTLAIPANGLSYTGTLTLASEAKPIVVKSATPLVFPDVYTPATGTWTRPVATGATPVTPLTLVFSLSPEGGHEGRFQGPGFDHPFSLERRGRPASVPRAGRHTLILRPPESEALAPSLPAGSGHATIRIAPVTAVLTLSGRLADGRPLTATIQPNLGGTTYLLWVNPYAGRLHSYVAGHLHNEHSSSLIWKKAPQPTNPAPKTLDVSYRAGFGPVLLPADIMPWLAPTKKIAETKTTPAIPAITLADRLGLATSSETATAAFGLDYLPPDGAAFTEAQIDGLPAALALTVAGKPIPPLSNPAKFALSMDAATGAFSGSFVLTDPVPAPTKTDPHATKPHPRKVTFSGVLRQPPASETDHPIGQGFFLVPALPGSSSTEQVSGEIRLLAPGE